jgi:hypothetical protein
VEGSRSLFLILITAFIKTTPQCVMLDNFNSEEDLHGDNISVCLCNMPHTEVSINVSCEGMDIISTKYF